MQACRATLIAAVVAVAAAGAVTAATAPAQLVTIDQRLARLADSFQRQGYSFEQVFAAVCRAALEEQHPPDAPPADRARAVFGGLWLWSQDRGTPVLQGRQDLALHFIGGGAFEAYGDAGATVALLKERIDSRGPPNTADLDDLAATMLGARWMRAATGGTPEQTRRWLARWANAELTLGRSLPRLRFGRLPAGTTPSARALRDLTECVENAFPAPTAAAQ